MGRQWRSLGRRVVQAGLERSRLGARIFWRLPAPAEGVALTFDDGPDPENTPRILDILARFHARATFFVVGEQALRHPDLLLRMVREGHTVGNHTHTHARCSKLGRGAFWHELCLADGAIRDILETEQPPFFRPPFGAITVGQAWRVVRSGRRVALWSQDTRDFCNAPVEAVAGFGERLQARDILLMHDRFPVTVAALPQILESLQRRGLRAVSLDEEVR
jgi:peptidoglycan-N-acetylglucosamine deacetylase